MGKYDNKVDHKMRSRTRKYKEIYSVNDLAEKSGVGTRTIYHFLAGRGIRLDNYLKIRKVLDSVLD